MQLLIHGRISTYLTQILFSQRFSRPLAESDWPRFREHSRRVKSVKIIEETQTQCGVEVYRSLGHAAGGQALFPNVKKIAWFDTNRALLCHLHVLMGSQVVDLTLSIDCADIEYDQDEWLNALKNLASTYPFLSHVDLKFYQHSTSVQEMQLAWNAICGWTQLHTLKINGLSQAALTHLAGLPNLQELTVRQITNETPLEDFSSTHICSSFPALRVLSVVTQQLSLWRSIIEAMQDHPLRSVKITVFGQHLTSTWKRFFEALKDHCNRSSLTAIWFSECHRVPPQHNAGYTATIDTIQALLSFPNLSSIVFPFSQLIITDSGAEDMAMAWPHLTSLRLAPEYALFKEPCLTLQGLVPFVERCRKLTTVTLALHTLSIPNSTPKLCELAESQLNLTLYLDTRASPLCSPKEVAAFLSALSPRITLDFLVHNCSDPWLSVGKLLGNRFLGWERYSSSDITYGKVEEGQQSFPLSSSLK